MSKKKKKHEFAEFLSNLESTLLAADDSHVYSKQISIFSWKHFLKNYTMCKNTFSPKVYSCKRIRVFI
jgi:hypothetical protein